MDSDPERLVDDIATQSALWKYNVMRFERARHGCPPSNVVVGWPL